MTISLVKDQEAIGKGALLSYNANNETWTVTASVLVESLDSNSVYESTPFDSIGLNNYGAIYSPQGYGADFAGTNVSVFNADRASIVGASIGIGEWGNGFSLVNQGSVMAYGLYGISCSGDDPALNNSGHIYGHSAGLALTGAGGTIYNSGSIVGDDDGLHVFTAGLNPAITNAATGYIRGGFIAIHVGAGPLSLYNAGSIVGGTVAAVACTALGAGDHIRNTGRIQGAVHLGDGNDLFNGTGGTSGAIFGEDGADHLIGGKSNDHLSGGTGNDTLTGGPGKDHFVFDAALGATNVDRINDFAHGVDKIDLSHAIFTKLNAPGALQAGMLFAGAAAHDADDHIIYNPANGWLTYDTNGKVAGGATHFATLAAHLTLTSTDFLVLI